MEIHGGKYINELDVLYTEPYFRKKSYNCRITLIGEMQITWNQKES